MNSVYFIGIGGSGMYPLACFTSYFGLTVGGSDLSLNSKQEYCLEKLNIQTYKRPRVDLLDRYDTVVYSSAIPHDHPEKKYAIEKEKAGEMQVLHRMDFLNYCMSACKCTFAIAGSHGKSTSSAMLAYLLTQAKLKPHIVLGAPPLFLENSYSFGEGECGIYESDESDASFLKSKANCRLLLNVTNDHLDHYGNVDKLREAFVQFIKPASLGVVNIEDTFFYDFLQNHKGTNLVGFASFSDERKMKKFACDFPPKGKQYLGFINHEDDILYVYSQEKELVSLGAFSLSFLGQHFLKNALGVFALALEAKERALLENFSFSAKRIMNTLSKFSGVERRLEKLASYKQTTIYDDYGHHPNEMKAVIETLKKKLTSNGKLIVIFQPHRYTRTAIFYKEFASILDKADKVFLLPVYSAGEKQSQGKGTEAIYFASTNKEKISIITEEQIRSVFEECKENNILLSLGAGNISDIVRNTLFALT